MPEAATAFKLLRWRVSDSLLLPVVCWMVRTVWRDQSARTGARGRARATNSHQRCCGQAVEGGEGMAVSVS